MSTESFPLTLPVSSFMKQSSEPKTWKEHGQDVSALVWMLNLRKPLTQFFEKLLLFQIGYIHGMNSIYFSIAKLVFICTVKHKHYWLDLVLKYELPFAHCWLVRFGQTEIFQFNSEFSLIKSKLTFHVWQFWTFIPLKFNGTETRALSVDPEWFAIWTFTLFWLSKVGGPYPVALPVRVVTCPFWTMKTITFRLDWK